MQHDDHRHEGLQLLEGADCSARSTRTSSSPTRSPRGAAADKVRGLIEGFRAYAAERIDPVEIDRSGTIPDKMYRELGELGLMGLYVDEQYGGQGLSQTGYGAPSSRPSARSTAR